jgi:predicted alpha-1,2-mannosidase
LSPRAVRRASLVASFLPIILIASILGVYLNASLANNSSISTLTTSTVSNSGLTPLENLTQFVNPFVGTASSAPYGAGDTFPGAAYPMGMVQWSPDTPSNPPGGYNYADSVIKDFSLTHFSGRGCNVYQDFPFMPYIGNISVSPESDPSLYYSNFSHSSEIAHPGYYQVFLQKPNVTVQLSVTPHTGIGQFTYPASAASTMILNAGGSINGNVNSSVTVLPSTEEVTGSSESTVGCGSNHYTIYFAAVFDRPFAAYGTWDGNAVNDGSNQSVGQNTGAFLVFNTTSDRVVRVQVGVSFVSVANAEINLADENANFNLSTVAKEAAAAWNQDLNLIQVQGGSYGELVTFYTALYHSFFHPNIFSDDNGQYLGFDGKVHTVSPGHVQYEDISGWDQYRTLIRLLAILKPSVASDVAQSLVNDAQQGDGHLPRWEQANQDSHGMSGDSGDAVIAEIYAFGGTNFNATGALDAMINGQPEIREGYTGYIDYGFVPADSGATPYSASVTLEYANDDFAIAQFAHALGNASIYNSYLTRSGSWENLFNNGSGYIQPRDQNGSWVPSFAPTSDNGFQEGDSAQYTWMVTYNLAGLFDRMGGDSTAVSRLNNFFTQLNAGPSSPYSFMGNEPSVEVPWEYDFAGAPSMTQQIVRQMEMQLFNDSPGGLPGNDDGGEISSWYVFAAMGLYPEITAVGGFVVGSPLFSSVSINLGGGHMLQIDSSGASDSHPYVQSLSVNGNPTSSLWLPWNELQDGAVLNFTLGNNPTSWGSSPQDAPPSFSNTTAP